MKNLFFTALAVLFLCSNLNAQAESYTDFEWDIIRFGYVMPSGVDGVSSGFSMGSEPRYNLKDNISVGVRWEIALYGAADDLGSNFDLGAAGSVALIGDYYFNTESSKRAFAGFGIGSFSGASLEVNGETVGDAGSAIGIIPRVGYEFGHLRLSAEYNLAFDDAVPNYLGINLGITLFGGYDG
ncbi:MAG: hypothetical protein AAGA77_08895 [Bacteroidota bacterium]